MGNNGGSDDSSLLRQLGNLRALLSFGKFFKSVAVDGVGGNFPIFLRFSLSSSVFFCAGADCTEEGGIPLGPRLHRLRLKLPNL